jgi:hypothetical protein
MKKVDRLIRFIESTNKVEMFEPDADETSTKRSWRLLYSTLCRMDLYYSSGLLTRAEKPAFELLMRRTHEMECSARYKMFEEKRAKNWNS